MFKKIDLFVYKKFFGPFLLSYLTLVFLFVTQELSKTFQNLIGKGIGADVFVEMIFYFCLAITPAVLPVSVLIACLIAYGNMGEFSELSAIKSAGISAGRIIRPVGLFVLLLTVGGYFFNDRIVPYANYQAYYKLDVISKSNPTFGLKNGVFYNAIEGYSIRAEKVEYEGDRLEGVMIYDHSQGQGNEEITLAESGSIRRTADGLLLVALQNGRTYADVTRRDSASNLSKTDTIRIKYVTSQFAGSDLKLNATDGPRAVVFSRNSHMRTVSELQTLRDSTQTVLEAALQTAPASFVLAPGMLSPRDSADTDIKKWLEQGTSEGAYQAYTTAVRKQMAFFKVDISRRLTQAIAIFSMFLIGAPLGVLIRKGGIGLPMLISIVFFVFFYILTMNGEKMGRQLIIPEWAGSWMANAILLAIGLAFYRMAQKDASLFDGEFYTSLFKRSNK